MCLAELGAMMPRSGGDYEFLHLGYGRGVAFAAGWLQLLVIFPGSLATVAVATATFQLPVLLGDWVGGTVEIAFLQVPIPNVLAAAMLSFALSFDDFIITNFNSGSVSTFPKYIYISAARGIPAEANVIASAVFLVALVIVVGAQISRAARAKRLAAR